MTKGVRISLAEGLGFFEDTLNNYIGIAASIANHRPLMEALLDFYFIDASPNQEAKVVSYLESFGVPTDVKKAMVSDLLRDVAKLVQLGFGILYPSKQYSYYFEDDVTIVVRELVDLTIWPVDDGSMDDSIDAYIPERLRHASKNS